MCRCLVSLVAAAVAPAAPAPKDRGGDDLTAIQGRWELEACAFAGHPFPAEILADVGVEIRDGRLTIDPRPILVFPNPGQVTFRTESGVSQAFKLDPKAAPKRIDRRVATRDGEQVELGIYRVDRDRLEVCFGGRGRPTAFRSDEKSGWVLYQFRRPKQ